MFDVFWIIWLNNLSFTCNETNLVLNVHLQIYLKTPVVLPVGNENTIT